MAFLRVRDRQRPGDTTKDRDLGPYPEVRRRFYPRRSDIDTALAHAAAQLRRVKAS